MTKATTMRMTSAVFLSKPLVATGEGVVIGEFLKLTVVVIGGTREE